MPRNTKLRVTRIIITRSLLVTSLATSHCTCNQRMRCRLLLTMPVGGYDAAFLHQVDKDLECSVCLLVLKEPIQTVCGHLLCKSCCENITQSVAYTSSYWHTKLLYVTLFCRNGQFRCPLCKGLCKQTEVS